MVTRKPQRRRGPQRAAETTRKVVLPRCVLEWSGVKSARGEIDKRLTQRAIDAALQRDDLRGHALCVMLVDDAECVRLHGEHFGDPTPTDVMSFPDGSRDPETGLIRLGDLAVCLDVARRVATKRKRPVAEEMSLYVLHGCLHLLGYDDIKAADRKEMWTIQREVMKELGVTIG